MFSLSSSRVLVASPSSPGAPTASVFRRPTAPRRTPNVSSMSALGAFKYASRCHCTRSVVVKTYAAPDSAVALVVEGRTDCERRAVGGYRHLPTELVASVVIGMRSTKQQRVASTKQRHA